MDQGPEHTTPVEITKEKPRICYAFASHRIHDDFTVLEETIKGELTTPGRKVAVILENFGGSEIFNTRYQRERERGNSHLDSFVTANITSHLAEVPDKNIRFDVLQQEKKRLMNGTPEQRRNGAKFSMLDAVDPTKNLHVEFEVAPDTHLAERVALNEHILTYMQQAGNELSRGGRIRALDLVRRHINAYARFNAMREADITAQINRLVKEGYQSVVVSMGSSHEGMEGLMNPNAFDVLAHGGGGMKTAKSTLVRRVIEGGEVSDQELNGVLAEYVLENVLRAEQAKRTDVQLDPKKVTLYIQKVLPIIGTESVLNMAESGGVDQISNTLSRLKA